MIGSVKINKEIDYSIKLALERIRVTIIPDNLFTKLVWRFLKLKIKYAQRGLNNLLSRN